VRRVGLLAALGLFAAFVVLAIRAWLQVATCDVASLARHAPVRTSMMRQRLAEAARDHRALAIDQRWVPYDRISPLLRRSVLVAEDDAFFSHDGLDWNEIKASAQRNVEAGHVVRGGSTITQQLARNLFLGSERSITRKLKEALLALRLERALEKRRIFELYLNEIEWGDGIFGAEAAAQRWFGVSAAGLDARQSALLAAIIINPRRYSPIQPSRRIERRVRLIASRLHRRGALDDDQYRLALGEAPQPRRSVLQWLFGSPDSTPSPPPADSLEAPPDSAL
jgi:monofunctional biosynthetic peptidoglycan transglycosylase